MASTFFISGLLIGLGCGMLLYRGRMRSMIKTVHRADSRLDRSIAMRLENQAIPEYERQNLIAVFQKREEFNEDRDRSLYRLAMLDGKR